MRTVGAGLVMLAAGVGLLSACGTTVQETLGLGKRSPDEFLVVRRAPLVLPPDLGALPPPRPGAPRPQELSPSEAAREVLTGRREVEEGGRSEAETALLEAMPVEAQPDIRQVLRSESTQLAEVDEGTYLFILNWQRRRMQERQRRGDVIDPVAESERLRQEGVVTTVRTGTTPLPIGTGSGS